ncbi:MAG: hypothetical protein E7H82_14585, partial [Klebsiella michiganensis]|nr:hypothetical protein [Klebsiella michiganensis]
MSENNYGALMMKSAISASIDINTLLSPGIYPISPGNPSSPDIDGGILTIHSGEIKRRSFTSNLTIFSTSSYSSNLNQWSEWVGSVSRKELISSSPISGGSLVMLPQEISVSDALKGVVVVSGADGTGVIDA